MDLNGAPLLYHVIARAKEASLLDDVVVVSPAPLELPDGVQGFVYDKDENDVLGRYAACLKAYPCDSVVRLTADCPLLDPHLIDAVVALGQEASYASNVVRLTFPDGMDAEIMSAKMLDFLDFAVKDRRHREHVTSIIRESKEWLDHFDVVSVENMTNYSDLKLSVDTEEDLERVRKTERRLFQ